MNKRVWISIVVTGLIAVFLVRVLWTRNLYGAFPSPVDRLRLEDLSPEQLKELSDYITITIKGESVLGFLNSVLLLYLLSLQIHVYRATKTSFILGLIMFSTALLLYSITVNPIAIWLTGFPRGSIMEVFNFIPDIFTTIATIILIYLFRQ